MNTYVYIHKLKRFELHMGGEKIHPGMFLVYIFQVPGGISAIRLSSARVCVCRKCTAPGAHSEKAV